jgi:hypothetical protein
MINGRFSLAQSRLAPPEGKALTRRGCGRAEAAGGFPSVIVDEFWSDTLMTVNVQSPTAAAEIFRRIEHIFVLIEDRARWLR